MCEIAIKEHKTRGAEVIELLEMLGGVNTHNLYGDENYAYYTIDSDKEIKGGIYVFGDEQLCHFTLEEFLEKFPYKVGDKVTFGDIDNIVWEIESLQWEDNEIKYIIRDNNKSRLCDIKAEHLQPYKEETMERKYNVEEYLEVWEETENGLEVVVNNNFELKEDNGKFYIIKKQPQYPKTYEECCEVLGVNPSFDIRMLEDEESTLYFNFIDLVRCRNAYWKIAGTEMGLDKPWKPDWSTEYENKYVIEVYRNNVRTNSQGYSNTILAFPTAEMRNAFFENFKGLIEQCKELL